MPGLPGARAWLSCDASLLARNAHRPGMGDGFLHPVYLAFKGYDPWTDFTSFKK